MNRTFTHTLAGCRKDFIEHSKTYSEMATKVADKQANALISEKKNT